MTVEFTRGFLKSLDKIKQKNTKLKIEQFILLIEQVNTIQYRVSFEYKEDTITFLIATHRSRIYDLFP